MRNQTLSAVAVASLVILSLVVLGIAPYSSAQSQARSSADAKPPIGLWDGAMQGKVGEVSFGIELKQDNGKLHAELLNATDRMPFSSAVWDGKTLTLRMDYYDGTVVAHAVSPERMEGEYSRQGSQGIAHIPLVLTPHREQQKGKPWTGPSLAGDWLLRDSGDKSTVLVNFQQPGRTNADGSAILTGVVEPVDGDTGLLHGTLTQDADGKTHFHLSRFDGIHVLALAGTVQPDGTLKGQFGGVRSASDFTAERSNDVSAADPNLKAGSLSRVKNPDEPFRATGIDAAGKTVSLSDPQFKGKAVIVDIFGTWCPNCHDEAPVLQALYRKYHDQGLEIVGLAYEYTPDMQRNLRQLAVYREKYGITFPLLVAGTTDQDQIAKTLPQLVNFGAFPTAIFLDRDGKVRAIHAGFTGPSTGDRYLQVQQHMDELTREILKPAK